MDTTTSRVKVRVSLQTGELEVEGSQEFVAKYSDAFEALISRIKTEVPAAPAAKAANAAGNSDAAEQESSSAEFPEALQRMSSTSGTDQILLAGAFARASHGDGTFSTTEANTLLLEQGIKLANPSQSMTNNLKAKRVFRSGKNWKISRTGEDYLRTLT